MSAILLGNTFADPTELEPPAPAIPRSLSAPENGDARLHQTLPDALRDLSALPAGAAARSAQCPVAKRPVPFSEAVRRYFRVAAWRAARSSRAAARSSAPPDQPL